MPLVQLRKPFCRLVSTSKTMRDVQATPKTCSAHTCSLSHLQTLQPGSLKVPLAMAAHKRSKAFRFVQTVCKAVHVKLPGLLVRSIAAIVEAILDVSALGACAVYMAGRATPLVSLCFEWPFACLSLFSRMRSSRPVEDHGHALK